MNARHAVLARAVVAACVFVVAAAAGAVATASGSSFGQTSASGPATVVSGPAHTRYVAGQVLVTYKAGVTAAHARADAARFNATVKQQITGPAVPNGRLAVVHSDTLTTPQLVAEYKADLQVKYAEPDYMVHEVDTPNDPCFNELWGMQQIYAPGAWTLSHGSSTVVIADIDTGIDYNHPDLISNLWNNPGEYGKTAGVDDDGNGYVDDIHGMNVVNNGNGGGDPRDDEGHGTHTAGTMAAVGNNGAGVVGVCWTARIMACKFIGSDGYGSTSGAISCVNYVIKEKTQYGVNVVAANNSWAGADYSATLSNAISAAGNAGIVFVCAAGNDGANNDSTPVYPASFGCSNIIAVAATDGHDHLASFSNYGASSVDLSAPGVGILSTVPSFRDSSTYAFWDGTSMATPHVTGAIALCAAKYPSETMTQRMDRVLNNVDYVPALSGKVRTGGRLDVARAMGLTPTDADIPGLPMHETWIGTTLDSSTDVNDVYHVFFQAGTVVHAGITTGTAADFDLYLFGRAAATVGDKTAAVASAVGGAYPRAFTYTVPTTGTYYLDACAVSGGGRYDLACSTGYDEIPGVTLPPSPTIPWLDRSSHTDNVFAAHLGYGQTLTSSIVSPPAGAEFAQSLYGPHAFSIWISPVLASVTSGAYPRTLTYTAWDSGTYYLDNYGSPSSSGQGWYTLDWSIAGPGDNDIPGAVPIPGSGYQGLISATSDLDDVFTLPLFSHETVNISMTGDPGTEYDLYVFDPSATTVEGHTGALASATGTSYPQSLTFTAPYSSSMFATNFYVDVHAVTGEGAYTITYSTLYDTTPPVTTAEGLQASATVWQNTAQQVVLSGTDTGGSGLAHTYFTINEFHEVYSRPLQVTQQGSHPITYWSVDNAANEETPHHVGYVNIDTTAPTTTATGLATSPTSDWRNTPATVDLTSTDSLSGVARILFTVDGVGHQYRGPLAVSTPGSHVVTYWAVDTAGNVETAHTGYVNIDATPPVTQALATDGLALDASTWHAGPLGVSLTPSDPPAADGTSSGMVGGSAATQYSTDGGTTWVNGTSLTFNRWRRAGGSGTFAVQIRSTDAAGNTETPYTATVMVDTSAPTSSDDAPATPVADSATVTITGHDAYSGIAQVWYSLDGGVWTRGGSPAVVTISSAGDHTIAYYAVDNVGNLQVGYRVRRVTVTAAGSGGLSQFLSRGVFPNR